MTNYTAPLRFRIAIRSPHWDDYPEDMWLVSKNDFTLLELLENGVKYVEGEA